MNTENRQETSEISHNEQGELRKLNHQKATKMKSSESQRSSEPLT